MRNIIYILLILAWIVLFDNNSTAQDWKKIVPLLSTCNDVKRIFKIERCEYPYTEYKTSEYSLLIELAEKNFSNKRRSNDSFCNVKKGTVLSVSIGLNVGLALKEFEIDFSEYEIKAEYDLPNYFIYTNKKTGVRLTVFDLEDVKHTMVIQSVRLNPSAENFAKYKCRKSRK